VKHGWRLVSGIVVVVGASTIWLLTRRSRQTIFPAWLGWGLANPLADRLFGTSLTLDRIGLRPGQRVLEIGPGPGRILAPAARRVAPDGEAVGLDVQAGMIERLRRRAEQERIANLTGVVGDAAALPFAPASFDVVLLVATLGEIADRPAALRQIHAALAPGGLLSITEGMFDPHRQPFADVQRMAEEAGFALRDCRRDWRGYTANFERR
jgi:SAM-dependent methyltransferase